MSAHQVEGGNDNQWTEWELETAKVKAAQAEYKYKGTPRWTEVKKEAKSPANYISGLAADHFRRYDHDFALAHRLNLNSLRVGIEWSRIEPSEGEFNKSATAHYKKYLLSMIGQGIEPVVTLWHWTNPVWFEEKGGFSKRRNIKFFLRYVRYICQQLGMHIRYIVTINEPTVYANMSYREERWPPQMGSKNMMLKVLLNLAAAHKKSYKIIKFIRPRSKVGLAHHVAYCYSGDDSRISQIAAAWHRWLENEWFINRVKRYQDFLGLNYYFSNRFCGTRVHNPAVLKSDLGWDMSPKDIGHLLQRLDSKYGLPILITENGLADHSDDYRQWWIKETVSAMNEALRSGVRLMGYLHWSLLDNFEWAEGFWPRFGLIEVDYETQQRKVRPSALWYARFIKQVVSR